MSQRFAEPYPATTRRALQRHSVRGNDIGRPVMIPGLRVEHRVPGANPVSNLVVNEFARTLPAGCEFRSQFTVAS